MIVKISNLPLLPLGGTILKHLFDYLALACELEPSFTLDIKWQPTVPKYIPKYAANNSPKECGKHKPCHKPLFNVSVIDKNLI